MFNYSKLFLKFVSDDIEKRLPLVLYTHTNEEFGLYGNLDDSQKEEALLILRDSNHSIGEIHQHKDFILVSIGSEKSKEIQFNVYKAMGEVYSKYSGGNVVLVLDGKYAEDAVYALVIQNYKWSFLKKTEEPERKIKIYSPDHNEACQRAIRIANAQNFARFLGDAPANHMTPTKMAEYLEKYLSNQMVDFKLFGKNFMKNKKLNLILAVAKGSEEEPVLVYATYYGRDSSDIDLAMVGKGVTFDTGGISIKPSKDMYKLKQDMMGAAILGSVFGLAVEFKLKLNISLTLPLVENMPGASSVKPGDIIRSFSNITVEIDNTDAEGKLILADAISFAQQMHPKYLIDVATLTGAVRIALGNVYGAYFTDNDEFAKLIDKSCKEANDPLWRMPLSPFYGDILKSPVVDFCNMNRRMNGAGASVAAKFIKQFVDPETIWAHFDVSGVRNSHFLNKIFGDQTTARPLSSLFKMLEHLEHF